MLPPDLVDQLGAHRALGQTTSAQTTSAQPASAERGGSTRAARRAEARRAGRRNVGLPAVGLALLIALTGTVVSWGSSQVDDPCTGPRALAPECLPLAQPDTEPSLLVPEPVVAPRAVGPPPAPAPPAAPAPGPSVPAAEALYVDPTTAAARQVADWEAQGRTSDAARLRAIADRPVPEWVTGSGDVTGEVDDYLDRATAAGAMPLLVAYNIPDRDCGSFSGGGAANGGEYRAWVADLAAGLGGREAIVVVEPDAIPHQLTGCVGGADERFALLAGAVDTLKAAGATVYLDAGNPGFVADTAATADALERSGIRRADGFSLNVANFYPTQANVEHGTAISQELGGGVRFVVDTSRNGAGRAAGVADGPEWCNPPGRRLGTAPTLDPGIPLVDALLWIKRPGESDGSCRDGEPRAGGWFATYALGLVSGS